MKTQTDKLKKGDRVIVHNTTFDGTPVIEGKATITKLTDMKNRYRVRFDGDPPDQTYIRFINPADKL